MVYFYYFVWFTVGFVTGRGYQRSRTFQNVVGQAGTKIEGAVQTLAKAELPKDGDA